MREQGGSKKTREETAPGDHRGCHSVKHMNTRAITHAQELEISIEALPYAAFFRLSSKLQTGFEVDAIAELHIPRWLSTLFAVPNQCMGGGHENTSV